MKDGDKHVGGLLNQDFHGKLEDGQIFQGLKLRFLETIQGVEKDKFVDTSTKPKNFKEHSTMTI